MEYTIKLGKQGDANIVGLPGIYLHFAHHNFAVVWNKETKRHESIPGVDTFYGGMGEGGSYKTWQDAIHASLYDAFQVSDELKDGDTFTVKYRGKVARFACDGVHVVKVGASFRVHLSGRKYRKFSTLEDAKAFCDKVHRETRVILSIEAVC